MRKLKDELGEKTMEADVINEKLGSVSKMQCKRKITAFHYFLKKRVIRTSDSINGNSERARTGSGHQGTHVPMNKILKLKAELTKHEKY